MYKVFKDNVEIIFTENDFFSDENIIHFKRINKAKEAVDFIDKIEILDNPTAYVLICKNLDKTILKFEASHQKRYAGGGWVINQKKDLLMIKRWGKWDIPKGHIEKG